VKVTTLFNLESRFAFKSYKFIKSNFVKDKSKFQGLMSLISSFFLKKYLVDKRVIIPESSNKMMIKTCKKLGLSYIIIKKRTIPQIILDITMDRELQPTQKTSILKILNNKYGTLRMNELKANHRRIVSKYLFEKYTRQENDILFDDSYFSGSTAAFFDIDVVALFGYRKG